LNAHLSGKKYRCATCADTVQVRVKTHKNRLFAEPDAKSPMLTIARAINGKKEDLGGYPCELVSELTSEIRAYRARFHASGNDDSECQSCPKCNRLAYQRSRDYRFYCTSCRNVFEDKYEA
jgi:transposase-like protein